METTSSTAEWSEENMNLRENGKIEREGNKEMALSVIN
jgi:hypothetical protein